MAHVFFSYSHADEELRNELEKHLAGLLRQRVITTWHDRRIGPGDELHDQIDEQLNAADIVLLLVSADFLASDYCYDVEMARAMERHEGGEARVIPVILRSCDWHGAPFGTLMAVPPDGKPVVKHATLDYNEFMSVSDDGYALFLNPMGMARFSMQRDDPQFTLEGAAEYFWSLFVEQLR